MNIEEKCEFLLEVSSECDFGDEMDEYRLYWTSLANMHQYVFYRQNTNDDFKDAWIKELDDTVDWIKENLRRATKTEQRTIEVNTEEIIYWDEFNYHLDGYKITKLGEDQ